MDVSPKSDFSRRPPEGVVSGSRHVDDGGRACLERFQLTEGRHGFDFVLVQDLAHDLAQRHHDFVDHGLLALSKAAVFQERAEQGRTYAVAVAVDETRHQQRVAEVKDLGRCADRHRR